MLALLTATTVLIGSWAVCSLARARGSMARRGWDAGAGRMAGMVAHGTVIRAGVVRGDGGLALSPAVRSVDFTADSTVHLVSAEAFMERHFMGVDSMVEGFTVEASTAEVGSMVVGSTEADAANRFSL